MFEDFGNGMDEVNQIAVAMLEDKDAERIRIPRDGVFRVWAYDEPDLEKRKSGAYFDEATAERFRTLLGDQGWNFCARECEAAFAPYQSGRVYVIFYSEDGLSEILGQESLWDAVDMISDELGIEELEYCDEYFNYVGEVLADASGEEVWDDFEEKRADMILGYLTYVGVDV